MKRLLLAAAIAAVSAGSAMADPIFGTWKTIPDDNGNSGHIQVSACGAKICGVLVKSFDKNGKSFQSENIGKQLIWDMSNDGDGYYSGGKVYSPDRDKTYTGKLVLNGNQLTVKGCVLGICRDGGVWSKVN
jgi:uncharacterized protein (DUF2147 family)